MFYLHSWYQTGTPTGQNGIKGLEHLRRVVQFLGMNTFTKPTEWNEVMTSSTYPHIYSYVLLIGVSGSIWSTICGSDQQLYVHVSHAQCLNVH